MKIYLMRHAESDYNVKGLSNGDSSVDVRLTNRGRRQAQSMARQLKDTPIDAVYTSTMPRAIETADIVLAGRQLARSTDARLNDLRMGFEGQSVDLYYDRLSLETDRWTARYNDGESLDELKARVEDFVDDFLARVHSQALIVSHYTVLQFVLARLHDVPKEDVLGLEIYQGEAMALDYAL